MKPSNLLQQLYAKVLHIEASRSSVVLSKELADKALQHGVEPRLEDEPNVAKWLHNLLPSRKGAVEYMQRTLTFTSWVTRYNSRWLAGDVIAGLTVGFVVVPQGMAYALLAGLAPEYGLYTSFTGAITYVCYPFECFIAFSWLFLESMLIPAGRNRPR